MSVSKEIKKLRRMLKDSSVAHAIFGWLSEYQRNTESMMVDKAEYSARVWARENFDHEVEVTRSEVISIMRELEELQLGRFIVGRRGAESRFEFWTSRVQIGQAAMGQIDEINIEEGTGTFLIEAGKGQIGKTKKVFYYKPENYKLFIKLFKALILKDNGNFKKICC